MEYIEGETLADRLKKGPLPLEQALKRATEIADARTDIFAFGAVLYEMVAGRRAFEGASRASLITAIMSSEPAAISELRPMSPPGLARLVKTCLLKDAEERCQNMHDVLLELKWIAEAGSEAAQAQVGMQRRKHRGLGWALAAFFLLISLSVGVIAVRYADRATSGMEPIRAQISVPEGASFRMTGDLGGPVTISPDGRHLAFAAATGEGGVGRALWVRSLDSFSARALPGTEGALFPFWSTDSRSIGFFADRKLKTIAVSGGPALTVCDAPNPRGGTWSRDDVILFAPTFNTGIH